MLAMFILTQWVLIGPRERPLSMAKGSYDAIAWYNIAGRIWS